MIFAVILCIIENRGAAVGHALGRLCGLGTSLLLFFLKLLRALLLFCEALLLLLGNRISCLLRLGHTLGYIVQAFRECRIAIFVCRLNGKGLFVFSHYKIPQLKNL